MIGQFDNLYEFSVGRFAAEDEAVFGEAVNVSRIKFITMTVAFADFVGAIDALRERTLAQVARVRTQPHRSAKLVHPKQVAQFEDDGIGRVFGKLGRVGLV